MSTCVCRRHQEASGLELAFQPNSDPGQEQQTLFPRTNKDLFDHRSKPELRKPSTRPHIDRDCLHTQISCLHPSSFCKAHMGRVRIGLGVSEPFICSLLLMQSQ